MSIVDHVRETGGYRRALSVTFSRAGFDARCTMGAADRPRGGRSSEGRGRA